MSDAEDNSIRQRHIGSVDEADETEELLQQQVEAEEKVQPEEHFQAEEHAEPEDHFEAEEKESSTMATPTVRVYRGIQPPSPPSFLYRQLANVKNFFIEFFEFIMLL